MIARFALSIAVFLSAVPALSAADWSRYVNPRFGIGVDIPAGFFPEGAPEVPGDGRLFKADNGRARITVWGAPGVGAGFSNEIRDRIAADEAAGWSITYRSETPDWAAWSGSRAGHVFYARAISTCGGRQTANVRFDYPVADIARFDFIVTRLGQSLAQDGTCF